MKNAKYQGSALVVVVIILSVIILAGLGYVAWNNFLAPKDQAKQTDSSAETTTDTEQTKAVSKTYENDTYTFQYPLEYWQVSEEHYDVVDTDKVTPVVKTDNWEQTGTGLDAGAEVSINTFVASQSLAEMKESASTFANGAAKDMKNMKVGGVDAFAYNMAYEGVRYHTVFIRNGIAYNITYRYADQVEPRYYYDGYDMIVTSFKFK